MKSQIFYCTYGIDPTTNYKQLYDFHEIQDILCICKGWVHVCLKKEREREREILLAQWIDGVLERYASKKHGMVKNKTMEYFQDEKHRHQTNKRIIVAL